jgi:hypothetical protein
VPRPIRIRPGGLLQSDEATTTVRAVKMLVIADLIRSVAIASPPHWNERAVGVSAIQIESLAPATDKLTIWNGRCPDEEQPVRSSLTRADE